MDPFVQFQENRDEMYALINAQRVAMDVQVAEEIEHLEPFYAEALGHVDVRDRMNAEQIRLLEQYRLRQQEYARELQELGQRGDKLNLVLKYNEKKIQEEQNNMEMHLLIASVLDRGAAAERVRMESLEKMIAYRRIIWEYYNALPNPGWLERRRRDEQEAALAKEKAMQKEADTRFKLRVLTTAALANIEAERGQPQDDAEIIMQFLDAEYSTRALEADYVIRHLDDCMRRVELIRRVEEMDPAHREDMPEAAYAPVRLKLEAVREYVNAVESVLWEYGLRIDFDALQIREIHTNDEKFAKRRRAYREDGVLRFYFGARRYRQISEEDEVVPDEHQEAPAMTRAEIKLSALEAKLGIRGDAGEDMRIMRRDTRRVDALLAVNPGEVIRAPEESAKGRMEDRRVKERFFRIYCGLKERIVSKLEAGDAEAFLDLEEPVNHYVSANRKVYENRRKAEEKEAHALDVLKDALVRVQRFAKNKCSKYAAILLAEDNNGYLEVPPDEIPLVQDSCISLGTKKIPGLSLVQSYRNCANIPLFTHRPNIKDVEQGGLGDCYLLAGLVSVVEQNAEEIMNIMKDNGDGTVTVRFMQEETDRSGSKSLKPYYVRVAKTIPVFDIVKFDTFSRGALWVKMMEKAYVASGLHILGKENAERKKKGDHFLTIREWRDLIVRGERRVAYEDIEGGRSGDFVSLLLGRKGEIHYLDKNRADAAADRIGRLLPPVIEPQWDPDPARRYGNDSADSIVYEYIRKLSVSQANAFLHLKKPADDDPDYDALMGTYRAQKGAMWFAVRSCMLQLDMIAAIAGELKVDILKLNSEKRIEEWYAQLMAMYAHFWSSADHGSTSLSREDKIIDGVKKNYYGEKMTSCFKGITPDLFQNTLNILKERHLALFRRNQQGGQGAGDGNPGQIQRSYYTYRDYKLYEQISERLSAGDYIAFGTRVLSKRRTGMNGESEAGGMVGEHAYSIINSCRRIIDGEERLFLVVINPWARKGVVYDVGVDGLRERAVRGKRQGEEEEGVFPLELKRFAEIVTHWDEVSA